jgi:hypothetical protein
MLKENGICFCLVIANGSDHFHEVAERIFGVFGPFVEADDDSLVLQIGNFIGSDEEVAVFVVGREELVDLEVF